MATFICKRFKIENTLRRKKGISNYKIFGHIKGKRPRKEQYGFLATKKN